MAWWGAGSSVAVIAVCGSSGGSGMALTVVGAGAMVARPPIPGTGAAAATARGPAVIVAAAERAAPPIGAQAD